MYNSWYTILYGIELCGYMCDYIYIYIYMFLHLYYDIWCMWKLDMPWYVPDIWHVYTQGQLWKTIFGLWGGLLSNKTIKLGWVPSNSQT